MNSTCFSLEAVELGRAAVADRISMTLITDIISTKPSRVQSKSRNEENGAWLLSARLSRSGVDGGCGGARRLRHRTLLCGLRRERARVCGLGHLHAELPARLRCLVM